MIKYLLLVILTIFLFMPLQNWEGLQKSATDDETIEQAIARLVAVHEGDSTSHLGVDESLASHKASDVIDHPASSIVADKFSSLSRFISYIFTFDFDSNSENYSSFSFGALNVLSHNSALTGSALAQWVNYMISDMGWVSGSIVVDFQLSLAGSSGTRQGEFNVLFAKVQLNATQYRLGYYNGSWQYGSWVTFTKKIADRWRIFYSVTDGKIYFYLNGALLGSFTATPQFDTSDYMFNVSLARGTSASSTIYFGGVQLGIGS